MSEQITCSRNGAIATVVLSNPSRLNAINTAMWRQLATTMNELSKDPSLRCVILRGDGTRAFSAGADIAAFEHDRNNVEQAKRYGEYIHAAMAAIRDCTHPTVALIQGICVGGGLEVAAMCDIRICGESSRFGIPANRLGLCVGYDEIAALIDLVGRATVLELLLEGRIIDAREAHAKGLVNRIAADEDVETEALACAGRICAGAPLVNRWHRKFIRRLDDARPLSDSERAEAFECFATEDFQIGYRARLAKTTPEFTGK